jgi:hypothetical protein
MSTPARWTTKWKYLKTFLLYASLEILESFSPGFPKLSLGVQYTPSLDELVFSAVRLGGLANGWPHTHLSSLSLSRD